MHVDVIRVGPYDRNGNLDNLSVIVGDIGFLFASACGLIRSRRSGIGAICLDGRFVAVGIYGAGTIAGGRIPCGIGGVRLGFAIRFNGASAS